MNLYWLGACLKCRGDLAYDDGDWHCLQCGVYYYTGLYPETQSCTPAQSSLRITGLQTQIVPPDATDIDGQLAQAAD